MISGALPRATGPAKQESVRGRGSRNSRLGGSDVHVPENHCGFLVTAHYRRTAGCDHVYIVRSVPLRIDSRLCCLPSSALISTDIHNLSLIHISEPTRLGMISYAV